MHTQACQTQCMGTSQSVIWNSTLLALPQLSFFKAMPMSSASHLQSSGLLWVVTLWHVHSLRLVSPLVSCLVNQAGTCSAGITQCTQYPKHYRNSKVRMTATKGSWKRIVGRYEEWKSKPWHRHHGSSAPRRLMSSAQLLLLWTYSQ